MIIDIPRRGPWPRQNRVRTKKACWMVLEVGGCVLNLYNEEKRVCLDREIMRGTI